jgi:hypothetical protein
MPWHITEVSSQDEDSLSDEELAQHNLLQVHRWENDGGATHKEETK